MNKTIRIILIVWLIFFFAGTSLYSHYSAISKQTPFRKPKQHPHTSKLISPRSDIHEIQRNIENNKLLVILVDFQEEIPDDPLTTGNGKFLLESDPSYRTLVASPPHNREYFMENLNALRYYYLAASQGSFNLQFDVFPQDRQAYTLPQKMSYYNPPGATSSLFISRIEEYFKSSFELADMQSPEIDFSQYGHFMIIHAGSDWQHDVFGDTTSDLPSFYIRVAEGKEAVVDNGNVLIKYACNVPSTISQDFDSFESNGKTFYTGYGALNGVLAHEFGHSLGLVDLYNVYNFSPMVGQFDIMDSGGAGITEDVGNPGVLVEGQLPALPGAFSRMIMFGDLLKERGLFYEVTDLLDFMNQDKDIRISASSQKQPYVNPVPNLIKIPLTETEYILVENRSVDPDNDGGTAIKGALNGRVALHPIAYDDPENLATYEYDYLLPSFVDTDFNAIGGGLLIWHVDEKVLYQQGVTNSSGAIINNFDNNSVNININLRGVRVIEADGLDDLGNVYSWFWTGTPFEYFHKYKPYLNQDGLFVNWTFEPWRPTLNAETRPALMDYSNQPSFYGLKDIDQPKPVMTFKLTTGFFDEIKSLIISDTKMTPLPVINSPLARNVLPVLNGENIHFFLHDQFESILDWQELIEPLYVGELEIAFEPNLSDINNDNYQEVIITELNNLTVLDFSGDYPFITSYAKDGDAISCTPIFIDGKLFVATIDSIYVLTPGINNNFTSINVNGGAYKLAATTYRPDTQSTVNSNLLVQQKNKILVIDPETCLIKESYSLPDYFTIYEPVVNRIGPFDDFQYYLMSDRGNIYKCYKNEITRIFINQYNTDMLTNLAITPMFNFTYSPAIVFAQDNRLFAIKQDGTLLPGYPLYIEGFKAKTHSHLKIRRLHSIVPQETYEIIYVKSENGGYLAVNSDGKINYRNCIFDMKKSSDDMTYIDDGMQMYWFYFDSNNSLLASKYNPHQEIPVLLWHGYRNNGTGQSNFDFSEPIPTIETVNSFVFPNPVKNNLATLRIENPDGLIQVRIYDIVGKLLYKKSYITEAVVYKDIQIDISKYSSGVYLVAIDTRNQTKRIKFSIEK